MGTMQIDMIIIAVEVVVIITLIFFVRKLSKRKKEKDSLDRQNAIRLREQELNDKLMNEKRR